MMDKISSYVEHIKGQPHHIRKQIAFGTAGVFTVATALVWIIGTISSGVLALKTPSFADYTEESGTAIVSGGSGSQGLAGAAAAPALGSKNAPSYIEIVDVASSTRSAKKPEQTTIPF
jgi:hypothetical protein